MPAASSEDPFDLFISHASEDKQAIVRPLAEALRRQGFTVWLDEDEVGLGDSIQGVIDRGLASARFGVVVLSPSFFAKAWTRSELGALLALEVEAERTMVLPVWHGIGQREVLRHAPLLADRIGVSTSAGLDHVAEQVAAAVRREQRVAAGAAAPKPAEDRLLRAVPLSLLDARQEALSLPRRDDGAARALALALGDRIVVGRAYAGQLHDRALEALHRQGHERVHWVTHWDDTALNQISIELGYRSAAGHHILTLENLTGYAPRQGAIELVHAGGRSRHVPPGGRLEHALDGGGTLVLVLGRGTGSQRLVHLIFEPVRCGGVEVPTLRTEGTLFWVPPGDPAATLVQFFGLWLPLTAAELSALLRDTGAELTVRFTQRPLSLTFFVDPEAGAMVVSEENLEQALGLL